MPINDRQILPLFILKTDFSINEPPIYVRRYSLEQLY